MSTTPIITPKRFLMGKMPTGKAFLNKHPVHRPAFSKNIPGFELTQDVRFMGIKAKAISNNISKKDVELYDLTGNDPTPIYLGRNLSAIFNSRPLTRLGNKLYKLSPTEKNKILDNANLSYLKQVGRYIATDTVDGVLLWGSDTFFPHATSKVTNPMLSGLNILTAAKYSIKYHNDSDAYLRIFANMTSTEAENAMVNGSLIYDQMTNQTKENGTQGVTYGEITDVGRLSMAQMNFTLLIDEAMSSNRMFGNMEQGKTFSTALGQILPPDHCKLGITRDIIRNNSSIGYVDNANVSPYSLFSSYSVDTTPGSIAYDTFLPRNKTGKSVISVMANVRDVLRSDFDQKSFDIFNVNIDPYNQIALSFCNGDIEKDGTYNLSLKKFTRSSPLIDYYKSAKVKYSYGPVEQWVMLKTLDPNAAYDYYIYTYSDGHIDRKYTRSSFWKKLGNTIAGVLIEFFLAPKKWNIFGQVSSFFYKLGCKVFRKPYIVKSEHVIMGSGTALTKKLETAFNCKSGQWVKREQVRKYYAFYQSTTSGIKTETSGWNIAQSVAGYISSAVMFGSTAFFTGMIADATTAGLQKISDVVFPAEVTRVVKDILHANNVAVQSIGGGSVFALANMMFDYDAMTFPNSITDAVSQMEALAGAHLSFDNLQSEYFMGPISAAERIKEVTQPAVGLDGGEIAKYETGTPIGSTFKWLGQDTVFTLVIDRKICYRRTDGTYSVTDSYPGYGAPPDRIEDEYSVYVNSRPVQGMRLTSVYTPITHSTVLMSLSASTRYEFWYARHGNGWKRNSSSILGSLLDRMSAYVNREISYRPETHVMTSRDIFGSTNFKIALCPQANVDMRVRRVMAYFADKQQGVPIEKYKVGSQTRKRLASPETIKNLFGYDNLDHTNKLLQYVEEGEDSIPGCTDMAFLSGNSMDIEIIREEYFKYFMERMVEYMANEASGVPPLPCISSDNTDFNKRNGTGDYVGNLESYVEFSQAEEDEDMGGTLVCLNYGNKNDKLYVEQIQNAVDLDESDRVKVSQVTGGIHLTEALIQLPELNTASLYTAAEMIGDTVPGSVRISRKVPFFDNERSKFGLSQQAEPSYLRTTINPTHFKILTYNAKEGDTVVAKSVSRDGQTYVPLTQSLQVTLVCFDKTTGRPVSVKDYRDLFADNGKLLKHVIRFERNTDSKILLNTSMPMTLTERYVKNVSGDFVAVKSSDRKYSSAVYRYVKVYPTVDDAEADTNFSYRIVNTSDVIPQNNSYLYSKDAYNSYDSTSLEGITLGSGAFEYYNINDSGEYYPKLLFNEAGVIINLGVDLSEIAGSLLEIDTYRVLPYEKITMNDAHVIVKNGLVKAMYNYRTFKDDYKLKYYKTTHVGLEYNPLYDYYLPNAKKSLEIDNSGGSSQPHKEPIGLTNTSDFLELMNTRAREQTGRTDVFALSGTKAYSCTGQLLTYLSDGDGLRKAYKYTSVGDGMTYVDINDRIDENYCEDVSDAYRDSGSAVRDVRAIFVFRNPDVDSMDNDTKTKMNILYPIVYNHMNKKPASGVSQFKPIYDNVNTPSELMAIFKDDTAKHFVAYRSEYHNSFYRSELFTGNSFMFDSGSVTFEKIYENTHTAGDTTKPDYFHTTKHYHSVYRAETSDRSASFFVEKYIDDYGIAVINIAGAGGMVYVNEDNEAITDSNQYASAWDIVFPDPIKMFEFWVTSRYPILTLDGMVRPVSDNYEASAKYQAVANTAKDGFCMAFTVKLDYNRAGSRVIEQVLFESEALRIYVRSSKSGSVGHVVVYETDFNTNDKGILEVSRRGNVYSRWMFPIGPAQAEPVTYVINCYRVYSTCNFEWYTNGLSIPEGSRVTNNLRSNRPVSSNHYPLKCLMRPGGDLFSYTNDGYYYSNLRNTCEKQYYGGVSSENASMSATGYMYGSYNAEAADRYGVANLLLDGRLGGFAERQENGLPSTEGDIVRTDSTFYNYALYSKRLDMFELNQLFTNLKVMDFSTDGMVGMYVPMLLDPSNNSWQNSAGSLPFIPLSETEGETTYEKLNNMTTVDDISGEVDPFNLYGVNNVGALILYGDDKYEHFGMGRIRPEDGFPCMGNSKITMKYPYVLFNSKNDIYAFICRIDLNICGLTDKAMDLFEVGYEGGGTGSNDALAISLEGVEADLNNTYLTFATTPIVAGSAMEPVYVRLLTNSVNCGSVYVYVYDNGGYPRAMFYVEDKFGVSDTMGSFNMTPLTEYYTLSYTIPTRTRTYIDYNAEKTETVQCPLETIANRTRAYAPSISSLKTVAPEFLTFTFGKGIHDRHLTRLAESETYDYTAESISDPNAGTGARQLALYNPNRTLKGAMMYNRRLNDSEILMCLKYLSTL